MSTTPELIRPQLPVPSDDTLRRMAEYFNHMQEVASGRRSRDRTGEQAILDHPGLNSWLDACRWSPGGLPNTTYLEDRRFGRR